MDHNPFENNELCDGGCCPVRSSCVRFMANVDLNSEIYTPYVIFNIKPYPDSCPYYLTKDNGHYPQLNLP